MAEGDGLGRKKTEQKELSDLIKEIWKELNSLISSLVRKS